MLKRFLGDTLIYTAGGLLVRGLSVLLVPFYTRVLSPADYGTLDMLTVLAAIVNLTVALEISQGLARHVSEAGSPDERKRYASTAFWFASAAYTLFLAVAAFAAPGLSDLVLGEPGKTYLLRIALVSIWANGLFYVVQNHLRFSMRPREYTGAGIAYALVSLGVAVILVLHFKFGVAGFLYGQIAGAVAGFAISVWFDSDVCSLRFDRGKLRQMLAFSMPLVPSSIGVFGMVYVDRIVIRDLMSLTAVGLYGVGYRLVSVIGLLLVGVQRSIVPLIFAHFREEQTPAELARIFRLFVGAAILLWAGVTIFAPELLHLLTTPAYYAGAQVAPFLAAALLLSNMYMFMPGLDIAKKTGVVGILNLGGALLNAALNYAFIPLLGIRGAGLATLISSTAVFGGYVLKSQQLYPVPHRWAPMFVATAPVTVVAISLGGRASGSALHFFIKTLALFFCCVMIVCSGLVTSSELRSGMRTARSRFTRRPSPVGAGPAE